MAHPVICYYCKKKFDRDKYPFIQINTKRYAHSECANKGEKDKKALEEYIKQLFNIDKINSKIDKQISSFVKEYGFSYSGIHRALYYHYAIKNGSIEKSNNGIGIVPYIYQEAYNYFYAIWEAQQINKDKEINQYIPQIKEIEIPTPTTRVKKRKLFSFLD